MNILIIIPYAPSLIRTRSYNLVQNLARRGHQVTLATLWENEAERKSLKILSAQGIQVIDVHQSRLRRLLNLIPAVLLHLPLQARYSWNPSLLEKILLHINPLSPGWDIIHVEHLRGAEFGLALKDSLPHLKTLPFVWDSVDNISHLFEQAAHASHSTFGRWITRIELPRTQRFERKLASTFDRVLVTSPIDKEAFERLSESIINISVLPNGVDLDYFSPGSAPRQRNQIVFTGKLSYHANVTAANFLLKEIMPIVWKQQPTVKVILAGKDPHPSLIQEAKQDSRIQVTGTVADLRPYLQQASVAVAPIPYGAGIQNKVLEAMACATPVVANSIAISAIKPEIGHDILVADTPQDLAASILTLLENPDFSQQIGLNGRKFAEKFYDWDKITSHLEHIYLEVIQERKCNPN